MMAPDNAAMVSVNGLAQPLVQALVHDAAALRLIVTADATGATLVDAGISATGGIEAGRRIAAICMGGLGQISVASTTNSQYGGDWSFMISVSSSDPVVACLGSQYAGWSLNHGEGKSAFRAMGSGPARALARREPLFGELAYTDNATESCLILKVDKPPPIAVIEKIAADCAIQPDNLTIIMTPTKSLAGLVQVVSRVLEVAMHKVHEVGFDLKHVIDGVGAAPLPPPGGDFLTSMGRSNDAILFGGMVHLFVACDDDAARQLAAQLPSSTSPDYGRPFADVFSAVDYDFYKIDPLLFAPAQVLVTNMTTGNSYAGGQRDAGFLARSFGGPQRAAD